MWEGKEGREGAGTLRGLERESGSLQVAAEQKGQRGQREEGGFLLIWFRSGRGCAPGSPRPRGAHPLGGRASCASGALSGPCGGGGGSGGLAGLAGQQ